MATSVRRPGSGSRRPGCRSAEEAIAAALKKDKDDHVREQAIFALSQLPDERATRALIATGGRSIAVERAAQARRVLAGQQSESKGAQAYLEKVLAGNVTR